MHPQVMICKSYPDLGAGKAAISPIAARIGCKLPRFFGRFRLALPPPDFSRPSTSQEVLVSFRRFSVSIVMVLVVLGVVASAQVEVSTATVPR